MTAERKRGHIDLSYEEPVSPRKPRGAPVPLSQFALFPSPSDNCAICTRKVDAGLQVEHDGVIFSLSHSVLEGHRVCAVKEGIKKGEYLLSWGLPFGIATRDIKMGEYVCNPGVLQSLHERKLDFKLPDESNFVDRLESLHLEEATFVPGTPIEIIKDSDLSFKGYMRAGNRGAGTRNFVVILGLTSRTGSFARILEQTLKNKVSLRDFMNVSGIVSVSHTEAGTQVTPLNNIDFVLRALSGFVVHPNVGAVLIVDDSVGDGADESNTLLTKKTLMDYMTQHNYPINDVLFEFLTIDKNFTSEVEEGANTIKQWLPQVNAFPRTDIPLKHLKIALQCGGSDAFSGVSGNPCVGWVAMKLIKHGGAANLAETDELMGAEPYIVKQARSLAVAKKFLDTVEWYKTYAGNHGHSAEGNPSGGNKYRGLYNIALKSLGAAMKKNPLLTLDHVINYAERMLEPGYYFMNSPGNDLESIAGQVGSGSNLIFFTTGNGSITNFPFVPTIKVVTTSNRFNMLKNDMDFNAGQYLDGTTMDQLGEALFTRMIEVASGAKSMGERAGHSQISIWRNWAFNDSSKLAELSQRPELLSGANPHILNKNYVSPYAGLTFNALLSGTGEPLTDQIGLVLPTSICSGQIAKLISEKLNALLQASGKTHAVTRFVYLPHTEGCGSSSGYGEALYRRTLLGHLINPIVRYGLLLEHGCEKTHNDYMYNHLKDSGVDVNKYGWASVQMDGGIDLVTDKVMKWFNDKMETSTQMAGVTQTTTIGALRLGILTPANRAVTHPLAKAVGAVAGEIVKLGGMTVFPQNAGVLKNVVFLSTLDLSSPIDSPVTPTLAYGQYPKAPQGFYVMNTMTDHLVENLTGLGATGVEMFVSVVDQNENTPQKPAQTHPMIPVLQVSTQLPSSFNGDKEEFLRDFDLVLSNNSEEWSQEILVAVSRVASRTYVPKLSMNNDFQIARDLLSVSM